ncbi:MAG: HAD-IIIC family phosphatase [Methylococcales bacterium]|nr:HAD-IIIC family phosphatase [Methylococcales bacterium]
MTQKLKQLDWLLSIKDRRELNESTQIWHKGCSVTETRPITAHLKSLPGDLKAFRLGIIHTYTSDLLDPWLDLHAAACGFDLHTYHAPYGLNMFEAQQQSGLVQHSPDLTLFMLQPEDLHPDLCKPVANLYRDERETLKQAVLQRVAGVIQAFRANVSGLFVLSILPAIAEPELGRFDSHAEHSESRWWSGLRGDIAAMLRNDFQSVILFDDEQLLARIGRDHFFDRRFWYSSRFPFTPLAANELAHSVMSMGMLGKTPLAKVIVLDADNTLWGGIIGEDGLNGIALGPDYPGNAFLDFQRRLLAFQKRGFLLALCSKNNAEDVQEVLDKHPHQLLRDEHFVARRVNWLPKSENIRSLAEELNLGLDSFIFVDDSEHECGLVRREIPQVEVIQTPKRPVDIPICLDRVSRLEIVALTEEDLNKTRLYNQERERRQLLELASEQGNGIQDYLASLNMQMKVYFNPTKLIPRLSQLSQKTNQFNLTTRRYNEQQISDFIVRPDWTVACFSLADNFGENGIVGIALINHPADGSGKATIDTFLMSCRVIGRQAESAFLNTVLKQLAGYGVTDVYAEYLPTLKNKLVESFYDEQGFTRIDNGLYHLALADRDQGSANGLPINVTIEH